MSALSGGSAMASRLQQILEGIEKAGTLKVGFLENATYPDGTPVAAIAAENEFGSLTNPMRPYFRTMIKDKSKGWGAALGNLVHSTNYDMQRTWQLMGEGIKGQLQTSIRDWSTPPNSAQTIARKGFNKPLIDTGVMINAVDHGVIYESPSNS